MLTDRLLYVAIATALLVLLMFDRIFAENLSRAFGEIPPLPLNPWELGVGGIFLGLIGIALYREQR